MKRKIIHINEEKCNGCALCIPSCPEGAIQMIDGKARLVSDLFCDGLGACLGECPEGAITIEEREAEPYNEAKVMENIVKQGSNVIAAHLKHLQDHNEKELLKQAVDFLKKKGIPLPQGMEDKHAAHAHAFSGCPGARMMSFASDTKEEKEESSVGGKIASQLRQWPIQMHLISPRAPYFQGKDLLVAADCVAYALGDFHREYLKGKSLTIACPKLDEGQDIYVSKTTQLIEDAKVNTITVMIMEVPCCMGLLEIIRRGAAEAKRKVPVKCIVVSLRGEILREDWVS
jgi:ferredoxin